MGLTIKYTALGGLIYATMGMYSMAFLMSVLATAIKTPDRDPDRLDPAHVFTHVLFALGFALALTTYIYRWIDVDNMPLQNLFEAFLAMMVLIWPISMISRWLFGVRAQTWDMLIGAALCFMPAFVRDADISPARPALQTPYFVPHVLAYMIGTVIMYKALVQAIGVLIWGDTRPAPNLPRREAATHSMVCIAFPPLTVGLILGCLWAKYIWGDFWGWDPKEQWSLAMWASFLAYFHMRYMFGRKYPRLNAAAVIACVVIIHLTMLWANLSAAFKGIHSYA